MLVRAPIGRPLRHRPHPPLPADAVSRSSGRSAGSSRRARTTRRRASSRTGRCGAACFRSRACVSATRFILAGSTLPRRPRRRLSSSLLPRRHRTPSRPRKRTPTRRIETSWIATRSCAGSSSPPSRQALLVLHRKKCAHERAGAGAGNLRRRAGLRARRHRRRAGQAARRRRRRRATSARIHGNRFDAELSSRGAGLTHFLLTDARYATASAGDMSTTPDIERWRNLRTQFRDPASPPAADDQVKFDRFDWKLETPRADRMPLHVRGRHGPHREDGHRRRASVRARRRDDAHEPRRRAEDATRRRSRRSPTGPTRRSRASSGASRRSRRASSARATAT